MSAWRDSAPHCSAWGRNGKDGAKLENLPTTDLYPKNLHADPEQLREPMALPERAQWPPGRDGSEQPMDPPILSNSRSANVKAWAASRFSASSATEASWPTSCRQLEPKWLEPKWLRRVFVERILHSTLRVLKAFAPPCRAERTRPSKQLRVTYATITKHLQSTYKALLQAVAQMCGKSFASRL